jgi:hypothetical protein
MATGVPTSTSYVPPEGVGSLNGLVHSFIRNIAGGYIRSASATQTVITWETSETKFGLSSSYPCACILRCNSESHSLFKHVFWNFKCACFGKSSFKNLIVAHLINEFPIWYPPFNLILSQFNSARILVHWLFKTPFNIITDFLKALLGNGSCVSVDECYSSLLGSSQRANWLAR